MGQHALSPSYSGSSTRTKTNKQIHKVPLSFDPWHVHQSPAILGSPLLFHRQLKAPVTWQEQREFHFPLSFALWPLLADPGSFSFLHVQSFLQGPLDTTRLSHSQFSMSSDCVELGFIPILFLVLFLNLLLFAILVLFHRSISPTSCLIPIFSFTIFLSLY